MVSSQDVISVRLLDMQGKVLHAWEPAIVEDQGFHYAQMTGDGDLWAIIHNKYAVRLGWDSQVKGKIEGMTHHDIAIPERGGVCLLDRAYRLVFFRGLPIPVLDDRIVFYSQEGEKKGDIGVYKFVAPHISPRYFFREYFFKVYGNMLHARVFFKAIRHMLKNENFLSLRLLDLLHTNSVQIIDRDVPGLCKLLWHWGPGDILMQHHATLLDNGHILLFDNGDSKKRPYSRVIELDPVTKKISWEYKADPPEEFYSAIRGAAQRLPNGNTLITESDKGRVFEVTKGAEVVWEFYNPEIDEKGENRVAIYRFTRIADPENYPALSRLK
jgi:hypothetical protein